MALKNNVMAKSDLLNLLSIKSELICNGLNIHPTFLKNLEKKKILFSFGRRTGAGPAGGRYFEFPDGSIMNIPINSPNNNLSCIYLKDIESDFRIIFESSQIALTKLSIKILPVPSFYDSNNEEGIQYKKIALIHGNETLATTINQHCQYWETNHQCQFCAIEFSSKKGYALAKKTPYQIVDIIKTAKKENPLYVKHITLTMGSVKGLDHGILQYIDYIKSIKENFPEIKIHIQTEPQIELYNLNKIYDAGADTIGIHIEILDPQIRKQICPGKGNVGNELYIKNWREAVKIFGKDQVDTFILLGYEKDFPQFFSNLEEVIRCGVIPYIVPVRKVENVEFNIPNTSPDQYKQILLVTAQLCHKYGINPLNNKAGCVRCGGCSLINDAYKLGVYQNE